jgi:transcriptional regulator with PAS, ATPase and Fis domain
MIRICAWCGTNLEPASLAERDRSPVTHGICSTCADRVLGHERRSLNEFLETLDDPVMMVDDDGVVLNANTRAQTLLNKDLDLISGKRGGDIIECEHSRSPGGCGSTEYCQTGCVIRRSVTHTFSTGEALERQTAHQMVFTPSGVVESRFVISTEKVVNLVLLRIDEEN